MEQQESGNLSNAGIEGGCRCSEQLLGLLYPTCNDELMKAADENGYLVRAIVIGEHVEIVLKVAFQERFQLGGVRCSVCVIAASRSIDCVCMRIIVDVKYFGEKTS